MEENKIFNQNYRSDFTLVFRFPEGARPNYPWRLVFTTKSGLRPSGCRYEVSFDGKEYRNSTLEGAPEDGVRIVFERHGLREGRLCYEYWRNLPNDLFPDGVQDKFDPFETNVELCDGPSDDSPVPDELIPITIQALRGEDGHTPYVGPNGNWWIDGQDTGKPSRGPAPVKGIDYFTQEEVAEITRQAAGQVPPVDVAGPIAEHDASGAAHGDIRELIEATAGRFGDYYDKTQTYTREQTDAQLASKVDTISGKGLSTNDYTNEDRAAVATISGKADAVKTYTTVVDTPVWTKQPMIEGPLDAAFVAHPEDFYFVTLKAADGTALPAGQFRLTPALDAQRNADPAQAIDQIFTLAGLDTGNSGALKESDPVDFTAVGERWRLRSGGVSAIKIEIEEPYRQGYDLNIYSVSKVFKGGYSYYSPFDAKGISEYYFALSGVGGGYSFGNQFLFGPPSWANARKHSFSNEVFRLRILPTMVLVDYSRSMMGFDGTLTNRTSVINNPADGLRINGVGFSLDEYQHPVSGLALPQSIPMTSAYIRRNGTSIRIELIKRT